MERKGAKRKKRRHGGEEKKKIPELSEIRFLDRNDRFPTTLLASFQMKTSMTTSPVPFPLQVQQQQQQQHLLMTMMKMMSHHPPASSIVVVVVVDVDVVVVVNDVVDPTLTKD